MASGFAVVTALTLSACAIPHSLDNPAPRVVPSPTVTETVGTPSENDLVIRDASHELHLESIMIHTNSDGSGVEPQGLVEGDTLFVFVRPAGWTVFADQFTGEGAFSCSAWHTPTVVEQLGGGWWSVTPSASAGTYSVLLDAASGPGLPPGGVSGSSSALLTWKTHTSTDLAMPTGEVGFSDGEGPTMNVWYAPTPQGWREASSTVTVAGAGGTPLTLEIPHDRSNCVGASEVWFDAELSDEDIATIGGEPYTYDVTVTIDGVEHRASASGDDSGSAAVRYSD